VARDAQAAHSRRVAGGPGAKASLLALLALATVGCAARGPEPFEPGDARYRFDIALSRPAIGDGSVTCAASVTDLETRRVIRVAPFPVRPGEAARGVASDQTTGARFEIDIALEDSGEAGTYEAALRRDGRLVASRRARVEVAA
jgi:hypothetical protein